MRWAAAVRPSVAFGAAAAHNYSIVQNHVDQLWIANHAARHASPGCWPSQRPNGSTGGTECHPTPHRLPLAQAWGGQNPDQEPEKAALASGRHFSGWAPPLWTHPEKRRPTATAWEASGPEAIRPPLALAPAMKTVNAELIE